MDLTFEAFVAADGARLGRLCHQLTGSHDDALDLAQEVLARVWQRWPRVSAADHPYAYVRRIAVNTHLNAARKRRSVPVEFEENAAPGVASRPDGDLWEALGALPPRQRAALVLRYYEDLPDEETAAVLGCRRTTVRSLVARGLATLRTFDLDGSRA